MITAILKLHCKDVPGVVHSISQFIFEHGGNIITSQQHKEELDEQFFMRVCFDMEGITCTRSELETDLKPIVDTFGMEFTLSYSDVKKRMAIMVSKYDHCLYDLLLNHRYGYLNSETALIISNHKDLEPVAVHFKIPYFYIPVQASQKQEADKKMLELFKQHHVDFVVLARYMQIVTDVLLEPFANNIINVHHGFLPAFKGAKPYHQAYEKGVKLIGATSHYATLDLDTGPIIAQETIHVDHSHRVKDMLRMGRDIEKQVLATAVKSHIEERIMVYNNRTIVFS